MSTEANPPLPAAVEVDPTATALPDAAPPSEPSEVKMTTAQIVLMILGAIAFLYFARPVILPVFLACIAGMTLKPIIRWATYCHLPPSLAAAVVVGLLMAAVTFGFVQLGRPALAWINEAPQHMADLRLRTQSILPRVARLNLAAAAVTNLGATEEEKRAKQVAEPTIEVKDSRGTRSILDWTGTLLVGVGETLVLIYLLLASGDLFLQKLVRVMTTLRDKKRAIEISREIQQNISNYLFSVTLINIGLGVVVSTGLYFMGVPNAAMWGLLVAILNYVPYFGAIVGVILLAAIGLLTFDTLWLGLLPPGWYLMLHLLESNFITPIVLGRRFTLNPVVIFVSLIFWTWLWGVPGALLSVPILVSIKAVCDRVPSLSALSEVLASSLKE